MTVNPEYQTGEVEEEPQGPWVRAAMYFFVWVPAAVFVLGLGSCVFGIFTAAGGMFSGPLMTVFFLFAIRRNQEVVREQRAMRVLGYVENAVRLNLPLDEMLLAAEMSERGPTRLMLMRIRQLLLRGLPLGASLEAGAPEIPGRMLRSISAAEQIGQLQPTLTRMVRTAYRDRPTQREDSQPFYRFYLGFVICGLALVTTGLMIFVVPKFRDIFKDFHTTLPWSTQLVIDISDWVANEYGWVFLLPLQAWFIFWLARMLQTIFVPGVLPLTLPAWREWMAWHIPFVRRLQRDRAFGEVFEYVGQAVRAGLPLPTALQGSLGLQMNYHVRERLMRWREQLMGGRTPSESARDARMPSFLVGLLECGETSRGSVGNRGVAEMFDFLSRYYQQRFSRLLIALRAASEPVAVMVVGAAVGFFVYSMFVPLVTLIQSVSGGVDGNGVL